MPRKIDPKTGKQRKHGEGKCDGKDQDVPKGVIDSSNSAFELTGNLGFDLTILEGLESLNDTLDNIMIPSPPMIPIPGLIPGGIPIYAVP